MKKNLEILRVEPKLTKDEKKFWRFETNEGWMSCFDLKECEKLKKFVGSSALVEVVESIVDKGNENERKFQNIRKCYGEEDISQANKDDAGVETEKVKERPKNNSATMYASYAKDIFCEFVKLENENKITQTSMDSKMKTAIELVKQAKEAFE